MSIVFTATTLSAQPQKASRSKYTQIPVTGNFEAILKRLLSQAEMRQKLPKELEDFLKQSGHDPAKLPLDLSKFQKEWKNKWQDKIEDNPFIQQFLKDLMKKNDFKDLQFKFDKNKFDAFKDLFQKFEIEKGKLPDLKLPDIPLPNRGGRRPPIGANPPGRPPNRPPNPGGRLPTPPDALKGGLDDVLKNLAKSDFLRDSDALKKAILNKDALVSQTEPPKFLKFKFEDIAGWVGDFELPDWEIEMPSLKDTPFANMTPPKLPKFNMPTPNLGTPSMPSAPATATSAAFVPFLLFLFIFFLAAIAAYLFWQKSPLASLRRRLKLNRGLGPWPVDPANIRTPKDLILAFNYLCLMRYGPDANCWNHKTAAGHLGEKRKADRDHAAVLATVYELARYSPADQLLSAGQLQQAQKCLSSLAGVAGR